MPKPKHDAVKELWNHVTAYQGVRTFPEPHVSQRGSTCGFSALAYVLDYWYQRSLEAPSPLAKPLPARSEMHIKNVGTPEHAAAKEARKRAAEAGQFSSLRQLAKHLGKTKIGSVFSAEDLLSVAKGVQNGAYQGEVLDAGSESAFNAAIEAQLKREVPVIVPFDVSDGGYPSFQNGDAAHWVAVLGSFLDKGKKQLLYFNWGEFYYAPQADFATSNRQLNNNRIVAYSKYEIYQNGILCARDYFSEKGLERYPASKGYAVVKVPGKESRVVAETNAAPAPASWWHKFICCKSTGSERSRGDGESPDAHNGVLRCKLVVVYPNNQRTDGQAVLSETPAFPHSIELQPTEFAAVSTPPSPHPLDQSVETRAGNNVPPSRVHDSPF